MIRKDFDDYCSSLKSTTHVIQWRGASVWKIGGKIFAICSNWGKDEQQKISFKCSNHSFHVLCELPKIIPAPYLARAKWVQITSDEAMTNEDICDYLKTAHEIICQKLPQAKRRELKLTSP